ncbi:MAG: DUF3887 domain-containing protein [Deltaproteobacteria bacterium]|nr:DUF3887 domain-containing protein [Deltaproteobacteria bacterium]MCW5808645.1 DUF3887 domain-containing protein [Deltaproteobacteria bacterium]
MPDFVRTGQQFLENLFAGEFAKAVEFFDPTLRAAVTDQQLHQLWTQITTSFGKPLKHAGTRTAKTLSSSAEIVYLSWDFEKERIDTRMVVNNANKLIGLSFETPVIK